MNALTAVLAAIAVSADSYDFKPILPYASAAHIH